MGDLGHRLATGALTTANFVTPGTALWVVTFRPQDMPQSDYEIHKGSAIGPGGYFQQWVDDHLEEIGVNGFVNAYDPNQPIFVRPGQTVSLHWSIGSGTAPKVWLYLRTPEVGRI